MKKKTTVLERVYLALFMILLYTPMVVLMVFSFNSSKSQNRLVFKVHGIFSV